MKALLKCESKTNKALHVKREQQEKKRGEWRRPEQPEARRENKSLEGKESRKEEVRAKPEPGPPHVSCGCTDKEVEAAFTMEKLH